MPSSARTLVCVQHVCSSERATPVSSAAGSTHDKVKPVRHARGSGVRLFETRINAHARIIWERAVDFSERLAELAARDRGGVGGGGAALYTEVVRVWRIVDDHDLLSREINAVIESHRRGAAAVALRQALEPVGGGGGDGPRRYRPAGTTATALAEATTAAALREWTPAARALRDDPAAADDGSGPRLVYPLCSGDVGHSSGAIVKKYAAAAALAAAAHASARKAAFDEELAAAGGGGGAGGLPGVPLLCAADEWALIRLTPSPPSSALVLGRSGSGKTTVLEARVWWDFAAFWRAPVALASGAGGVDSPVLLALRLLRFAASPGRAAAVTAASAEAAFGGADWAPLRAVFITKQARLRVAVEGAFEDQLRGAPAVASAAKRGGGRRPVFFTTVEWLASLDEAVGGARFFGAPGSGRSAAELVDFRRFERELWPGIRDGVAARRLRDGSSSSGGAAAALPPELSPALVWAEIRSHIKGGVGGEEGEAPAAPSSEGRGGGGCAIPRAAYAAAGRKLVALAPRLREAVYDAFEEYAAAVGARGLRDACDAVADITERLIVEGFVRPAPSTCAHRFYVDEAQVGRPSCCWLTVCMTMSPPRQDHTRAELWLALLSAADPNGMFITGDTAQASSRGGLPPCRFLPLATRSRAGD